MKIIKYVLFFKLCNFDTYNTKDIHYLHANYNFQDRYNFDNLNLVDDNYSANLADYNYFANLNLADYSYFANLNLVDYSYFFEDYFTNSTLLGYNLLENYSL